MSLLTNVEHSDMQLHETRNGQCPSCGERKFYVTRKPNGFAYICFRASCNYHGFVRSGIDTEQDWTPHESVEKPGNPYYHPTCLIDEVDMEYFEDRFQVRLGDHPADAAYWCKLADDGRYVFPMWGPRDEYRGCVLRRPVWSGEPEPVRRDTAYGAKAMVHWEKNVAVRLAWYHSTDESTVVLVEDQVSAMRIASSGVTSVAILGTNFYSDFVRDFNNWHRGEFDAIIALDPDAATKALKLARTWGPTFHRPPRVAMLKHDPKDYATDKELWEDLGL